MSIVTWRLDGDPGGNEDRAKVTQVRLDFSTPPRTVAPQIRVETGLCYGGWSPVELVKKGRE